MLNFLIELVRIPLILWARSGRASGWLVAFLAAYGPYFKVEKRLRRTADGFLFECDLRDRVQQLIYFFGSYEPVEVSLLLSLVNAGDVVVDAGANIGFFTFMLAKKVGSGGQVHSFEPVVETNKQLCRHHMLNGSLSQIKINSLALWNKSEVLTFSIRPSNKYNCGGFSAAPSIEPLRTERCEAISFVEYFQKNSLTRLDAIKMDIEGAELFALQGALPLIERFRPVICLEISQIACQRFDYGQDQLWNFFKPLGYKIYKVGSTHSLSGWVDDFSTVNERNVLLIPPNKLSTFNDVWDDKVIKHRFLNYS